MRPLGLLSPLLAAASLAHAMSAAEQVERQAVRTWMNDPDFDPNSPEENAYDYSTGWPQLSTKNLKRGGEKPGDSKKAPMFPIKRKRQFTTNKKRSVESFYKPSWSQQLMWARDPSICLSKMVVEVVSPN